MAILGCTDLREGVQTTYDWCLRGRDCVPSRSSDFAGSPTGAWLTCPEL
jgi:hypothetical protein